MKLTTPRPQFIFGHLVWDLVLIHLPTYLILLYFSFFRNELTEVHWHKELITFIALVLVDNGHVYTTLWRTYLNKKELLSHHYYQTFPPICFFLILVFTQVALPWFWVFVVYFTLYHNLRQLYGFYRWYGSLHQLKDRILNFLFYALCLCPVFIFHTAKARVGFNYYHAGDSLNFENALLNQISWGIYFTLGLGFVLYAGFITFRRKNLAVWPMFLFMVTSFVLYGLAFIPARTSLEIIGPLAFSHGISYFGAIALSMYRLPTQQKEWPDFSRLFFKSGIVGISILVVLTAIVFGVADDFFQERFIDDEVNNLSLLQSLFIALWVTPLFSHYYFDSKLWRHTNKDFSSLLITGQSL